MISSKLEEFKHDLEEIPNYSAYSSFIINISGHSRFLIRGTNPEEYA